MLQGELLVIDDNNKVYLLPCGDLCSEGEDVADPLTYTYLGCYADAPDRVLSGNFILAYSDLTTEVRRGPIAVIVWFVLGSVSEPHEAMFVYVFE